MKSLKNKFFIGLAVVAMTATSGVYAQNSAPSSNPATENMRGKGMDHAKMAEKMKAGMAQHLAEMHDKLKLSGAQEPAWKTFITAITPGAMPAHPDRTAMEKMTAPERMEKMLVLSKERLAKMESRLAALKTFYAVLTPEQKKLVDASHSLMRDKRHHGMHGAMNGRMQDEPEANHQH